MHTLWLSFPALIQWTLSITSTALSPPSLSLLALPHHMDPESPCWRKLWALALDTCLHSVFLCTFLYVETLSLLVEHFSAIHPQSNWQHLQNSGCYPVLMSLKMESKPMSTQQTHCRPGFCYFWSGQEFSLEPFGSCLFSLALAILPLCVLWSRYAHGHSYALIYVTHIFTYTHIYIPYISWHSSLPSTHLANTYFPSNSQFRALILASRCPPHWSAAVGFSSLPSLTWRLSG